MRLCGKKAAILGVNLGELIGIILAIFIVITTAIIAAKLTQIFAGGQAAENTKASLISLTTDIKARIKDTSVFSVKRQSPYYIHKDYVIVGFDKVQTTKPRDMCDVETVTKPSQCGKDACICLYENEGKNYGVGDDDTFDGYSTPPPEPIVCHRLPRVDYVYSYQYRNEDENEITKPEGDKTAGDKAFEHNLMGGGKSGFGPPLVRENSYGDLILYGQCDDFTPDVNFKLQKLYIEKFVDKGKTYIFIAGESPSLTGKRYDVMFEKHGAKEIERYETTLENLRGNLGTTQSFLDFIKAYEQFKKEHPTGILEEKLLQEVGYTYYRLGKKQEAHTVFKDYFDKYPGGKHVEKALYYLGEINYSVAQIEPSALDIQLTEQEGKDAAEAVSHYSRIISKGKDNKEYYFQALYNLAVLKALQGKYKEANNTLQQFTTLEGRRNTDTVGRYTDDASESLVIPNPDVMAAIRTKASEASPQPQTI